MNFTRRQPYGVVAKLNPFNHPFRFCAEKAAAPLAAGNCVVIKSSEQAPLSSLRLGELCEGIFPPGVVNVITGDGATGAALVRAPGRAAHRLCRLGARRAARSRARQHPALKRVSFELGGKNPIIIFPDADPKKAAAAAIKGMNMNRQGQSCSSTSRVFVHGSLHKAVHRGDWCGRRKPCRSAFRGSKRKRCRPDRLRSASSTASWASLRRRSQKARSSLTGGGKPADKALHRGLFIAPTVFDGVTPHMRIGREEIFGPVMSVLVWDDYADMLAKANGLEYGLTAAIVTN